MNRTTKLVVAAGLAAATIAIAGGSAGATPPPTQPADFVTLTDDTGTITVGIPTSWTDVETAPRNGVPSVLAAPDLEAYRSPSNASGTTLQVGPFTTDTDPSIFSLVTACADQQVVAYDDGALVGSELVGTACGDDGLGEFHAIVANPSSQAFTAYLLVNV